MDAWLKSCRVLLLSIGCLPLAIQYGALSVAVLLFAFPAVFLGGNPGNAVFVIWWLLGTYGMASLIYSCATYQHKSRPPGPWQRIGLVLGVMLAVPLVALDYTHGLEKVPGILGAIAATIVLLTSRKDGEAPPIIQ